MHSGDQAPCIQFAADSRITEGNRILNDAKKIVEVKHPNGSCLLAKAGYKTSSDRFEEMFAARLSTLEVKSYRAIATAAEDAIRDLSVALLDRNYEGARDRLDSHHCAFLIGYFYERKPYIFSLDLRGRLAVENKGPFVAEGSAAPLANFLLGSLDFEDLDGTRATRAGIALVEMCKIGDASCGGPVQLGGIIQGSRGVALMTGARFWKLSDDDRKSRLTLMKAFADNFWFPEEWKQFENLNKRPQGSAHEAR
jgi:20S proteasome alpha/beta subunit